MEFQGALGKLGVRAESIKSGPLKDMGSPFKALRERAGGDAGDGGRVLRAFRRRRHHPPPCQRAPPDPAAAGGLWRRVQRTGPRRGLSSLGWRTGPAGWRTPSSSPSRRERRNAKAILYRRPYGYAGSIYAESQTPRPRANVLQLELPESRAFLPSGFYYLGTLSSGPGQSAGSADATVCSVTAADPGEP